MEAPVHALQMLKVPLQHMFSCDVLPAAVATIRANHKPKFLYPDLMKRNNKNTPYVDIYVAGFPCQSFSLAGKRLGFEDPRGKILWGLLDYIGKQRPALCLLENVSNLIRLDGGKVLETVLQCLRGVGGGCYNVTWSKLDTCQHGVPQSRPRVWFLMIRKDVDRGTFEWPEPLPAVDIDGFLEKCSGKVTAKMLPPKSQTTAMKNVTRVLSELKKKKINPFKVTHLIDCDSSPYRCKVMKGKSPCITRSRGAGHWVTSRGRRLTLKELFNLHGMKGINFKQVVSDSQQGKLLGNSMSLNVLERIFVRALPAAGLMPASKLHDRWEAAAKRTSSSSPSEAPATPQRKRRLVDEELATPEKQTKATRGASPRSGSAKRAKVA